MREDQKTNVDVLDPEEHTKNWPGDEPSDIPVFLRDSSDGDKGNAQDEKDKSAE